MTHSSAKDHEIPEFYTFAPEASNLLAENRDKMLRVATKIMLCGDQGRIMDMEA